MRIELPEWGPVTAASPEGHGGWITIGALYNAIEDQLRELPPAAFGKGRQMPPGDNPGPGRLVDVIDLDNALEAIATIVDQGEGHKPASSGDPGSKYDDDHEVAHYYQFQTIANTSTPG